MVPAGVLALALVTAVALYLREPAPQNPAGSWGAPPRAGTAKPITVFRFVDPDKVEHRTRFLFSFDPPSALAGFRQAEGLDAVVEGASTDLERVRRMTAWARKQFEPGVPDPYPPLDARVILRDIRSGATGGFCAQYNYVLAQALMSMGYLARYVTVVDHEVIEAWLPDDRRWICLDPLHGATYVDESGKALSVLELSRRHREGLPVIPGPGSLPGTAREVAEAFERFWVWLRNDHISHPINFTDIDRYKVRFLWDERDTAQPGVLSTSLAEDLYFTPALPREGASWWPPAETPAPKAPGPGGT